MTIKNKIKAFLPFIPPILLDKAHYIRNYNAFRKYKELVAKNIELKDKHKGQRCFLLGSGPSIKQENLKLLKNEIVFALNNFYVHPDFQEIMSGNVEKYYMTVPVHLPQTEQEWKSWFMDMEKNMPNNATMMFGLNGYKENIKYIFDKHGIFQKHKLYWYITGVNVGEYYHFNEKHIDIMNMIWNANTVSIYALIIAIYMGFDEIYLLGMDHDYICNKSKDWRFYQDGLHQKDEIKRTLKDSSYNKHEFLATGKIFEQYELLSSNTTIKIYNISSSSLLDVFNLKNLDEIITNA
jgi:hypothetical protein